MRDPKQLPWGELGVDVVIESTGFFTDRDKAAMHLEAGAPFVIVSAPVEGRRRHLRAAASTTTTFDPADHKVVSNASCTTNCFVPMVKVLDDAFGVEQGFMTTVHAYTGDQMLVDGPHSDLRRARAAAINIVPTSTGAARATGLVLESMKGKLDGSSLRVPVPDGLDHRLHRRAQVRGASVAEINAAYQAAADGRDEGDPGVHGRCPSCRPTSSATRTAASSTATSRMSMGNLVKVLGWYDNEWGYSNRLVDLTAMVGAANER